jgi:hypothetical protein
VWFSNVGLSHTRREWEAGQESPLTDGRDFSKTNTLPSRDREGASLPRLLAYMCGSLGEIWREARGVASLRSMRFSLHLTR